MKYNVINKMNKGLVREVKCFNRDCKKVYNVAYMMQSSDMKIKYYDMICNCKRDNTAINRYLLAVCPELIRYDIKYLPNYNRSWERIYTVYEGSNVHTILITTTNEGLLIDAYVKKSYD